MNNQLLEALTQIRDSLQQQHVQQQQQKIQQQLLYHQRHLQSLASDSYIPNDACNSNSSSYDRDIYGRRAVQPARNNPLSRSKSSSINNINNNTTKVLITNGNMNENADNDHNNGAYLGEQALKMLSELKSSSC